MNCCRSLVAVARTACCAVLLVAALPAGATGTGEFNFPIHWDHTPPLYYTVTGGPANTCGDLVIQRNGGAWTRTTGWLCTDAAGGAVKGPWYWADQPGDETAEAYIEWPDGSQTTRDVHIWDIQRPTVGIHSWCSTLDPATALPSCFAGTAYDGVWGACFDASWSFVWTSYKEIPSNDYYDPATGAYDSLGERTVSGSFSGLPGCQPGWTAGVVPPPSAHRPGYLYEWKVYVYDGGALSAPATYSFYYDP